MSKEFRKEHGLTKGEERLADNWEAPLWATLGKEMAGDEVSDLERKQAEKDLEALGIGEFRFLGGEW